MKPFLSIMHYCSFLLASCLLFTGCGPRIDEEGRHNIRGSVTYDGTLLTTGEITFTPLETQAPKGAQRAGGNAKIQSDGTYALTRDVGLFEGTYEVRIRAYKLVNRDTGKDVQPGDDEDSGQMVDLIPKKYQTNPEITITVGTEKNQTHDFTLEK